MTSPDARPEPTTVPVPVPATPAPAAPLVSVGDPAMPEQSREDTDAAWGDYPESADDHLYRDRPPHWNNF